MKKKYLTLVLLSCMSLMACTEEVEIKNTATRAVLYELPKQNTSDVHVFTGIAKAHELTELSFRVDGKIASIKVINGQQVKTGELLAVLDKTDYEISVNDRRARNAKSLKQYQRAKTMLDKNMMSKAEYDKLKAEYLVANAELKMAELHLKYTELRAPFDGVIGDVYLDDFENILPGTSILSLHKPDHVEVDVQVPDSIVASSSRDQAMQGEQKFNVVFEGYPDTVFEAKVLELGMNKDPISQSYIATLIVNADPEHIVLEGMPAKVSVELAGLNQPYQSEYLVPLNAIQMQEGNILDKQTASVWVYQGESQTVTRREVLLGKPVDGMMKIKAGLNDGEMIISEGASRLTEGQKVVRVNG
ncbi:efflux RND transporter periplasmic adaptor subunit [Photobacterium rosenbergii]|uniref:efflux RND transporter periplasmic adaptor subunit n=1 Tax=Photobacterium rosenbergii TaxID=294936 RepID=UPI001C998511|nr:efflux RND transporter periplasmic adaptor subunit [Photobacterium rosenbergii]MBY5946443.1 efflux RND transporter periplasmic adaptor subunit [Photobacterium rosenbergii]